MIFLKKKKNYKLFKNKNLSYKIVNAKKTYLYYLYISYKKKKIYIAIFIYLNNNNTG